MSLARMNEVAVHALITAAISLIGFIVCYAAHTQFPGLMPPLVFTALQAYWRRKE